MCQNKLARERLWLQGGVAPRLGLRLAACNACFAYEVRRVSRWAHSRCALCPLLLACWHTDSRREQRQRARWFAQLFCSTVSGPQCPALVPSAQQVRSCAPAPTACISSSSSSANASATSTNARTSASASAAGDGRRSELHSLLSASSVAELAVVVVVAA